MIGAASTAMSVPATAPPPAPRRAVVGEATGEARRDTSAPRAGIDADAPVSRHDPAQQDPPPAEDVAGGGTATANASTQRDLAARARKERDGLRAPHDFALLLAASGTPQADAAKATAAASIEKAITASDATAPAAAATPPDRLLMLLSDMLATPGTRTTDSVADGSAPSSARAVAPPFPGATTTPAAGLPLSAVDIADATASRPGSTDGAAVPPKPPAAHDASPPNATTFPATVASATPAATGDQAATLAKLSADAAVTTIESASGPASRVADAAAPADTFALPTSGPTATATRTIAPPTALPLAMPVDPGAGFDDGFGTRIAWMAEQRIGHAEIRLNPEHVGAIDVRLQLDGNRVTAEFHSAHAEVRQAIEASVPRLRELLGQHGLQLGQADVGQRQSGNGPGAHRGSDGNGPGVGADDARTVTTHPVLQRRGLLDEYA